MHKQLLPALDGIAFGSGDYGLANRLVNSQQAEIGKFKQPANLGSHVSPALTELSGQSLLKQRNFIFKCSVSTFFTQTEVLILFSQIWLTQLPLKCLRSSRRKGVSTAAQTTGADLVATKPDRQAGVCHPGQDQSRLASVLLKSHKMMLVLLLCKRHRRSATAGY